MTTPRPMLSSLALALLTSFFPAGFPAGFTAAQPSGAVRQETGATERDSAETTGGDSETTPPAELAQRNDGDQDTPPPAPPAGDPGTEPTAQSGSEEAGPEEAGPEATAPEAPPADLAHETPVAAAGAEARDQVAQVRAALDAHDYMLAHELVTRLVVDERLARAEELFAAGRPEDGLLEVDAARVLDPRSARVQLAFGRGSLLLAEQGLGALYFEDALRAFESAGDTAAAHSGASRAAYGLFDFEAAMTHAERAIELADSVSSDEPYPATLSRPRPERRLAEAAFGAYAEERRQGTPAEKLELEYERAQRALATELGFDALDPWVHERLGLLAEWSERPLEARAAVRRGLDWRPDSELLHQMLTRLCLSQGGPALAIETYTELEERYPEVGLVHWFLAQAHCEAGLERLQALATRDATDDAQAAERAALGTQGAQDFERAEAQFARCRELAPEFAEACRDYETVCRDGRGWSLYHAGDADGAEAAFLSMNAAREDGIHWALEGRLLDGVQGLRFVTDLCARQGDFAQAARVSDLLREFEPDNVTWTNNAGFFHREAGTALEERAARWERMASELPTPEEPDRTGVPEDLEGAAERWNERLREIREQAGIPAEIAGTLEESAALTERARALQAEAREHYEKSYAAYLVASALAPDDVRIENDTALIALYHLKRDLERAEEMLLDCVAKGEQQLDAGGLDENERFDLENAWGDAHENLGYLYLNYKNDPATARGWLEKSLAIGPGPRPACVQLLRECDARLSSGAPVEAGG